MPDRVRAILLAGGESRRMGVCKQTLPLGGKPVIVHCVDALTEARHRVTVVAADNEPSLAMLRRLGPATVTRDSRRGG